MEQYDVGPTDHLWKKEDSNLKDESNRFNQLESLIRDQASSIEKLEKDLNRTKNNLTRVIRYLKSIERK